jgi:hypothetical protein
MMMAPHHKTEIKGVVFSRQGNYSYFEDRLKGNDPNSAGLKDIKSINKCFQKSVTAKI